jgi:hypothetical protein
VEAIGAWRQATKSDDDARLRPFLHRGENYLLRMVGDLDFLAGRPVAAAALREIDPRGNPFLSPMGGLVVRRAALERGASPDELVAVKHGHLGPVDALRVREAERALISEARALRVPLVAAVGVGADAAVKAAAEDIERAREAAVAEAARASAEEDRVLARRQRPWGDGSVPSPAAAAARRVSELTAEMATLSLDMEDAEAALAIVQRRSAVKRQSAETHGARLRALVVEGFGQGSREGRSVAAQQEAAFASWEALEATARSSRAALCHQRLELQRLHRLKRAFKERLRSRPAPEAAAAGAATEAALAAASNAPSTGMERRGEERSNEVEPSEGAIDGGGAEQIEKETLLGVTAAGAFEATQVR